MPSLPAKTKKLLGAAPYLALCASIYAKLVLAHLTLDFNVGQLGPWTFLERALRGLLHADTLPAYRSLYLVSLGTAGALTAWTLLFPRRLRPRVWFALDAVLSVLILGDTVYFRYFHDFLTLSLLGQASMVGSLASCIRALLHGTDLLFFADLVAWGGYALWRRRRPAGEAPPRSGWRPRLLQFGGALVLSALLIWLPVSSGLGRSPGLLANTWSRISLYNIVGLFGLHGITETQYLARKLASPRPSGEELAQLRGWFIKHRAASTPPAPSPAPSKKPNVIVVQMEAFQNFVIGLSVGGVEVTPNLNRLVQEAAYFPNFFHESGQGRTSDAEFVVNCSLARLDTGSVYVRYPSNRFVCLPGQLRKAGYYTAVFHGNDGSFYNRYRVYPNLGFDRFFSRPDYSQSRIVGMGVSDEDFVAQTLQKLDALPRPFYSVLITLSSHYPFDLPADLAKLPADKLPPGILGRYLQSIHYLDHAMGQLIDGLKRSGRWADSVVAFYGDHDNGIRDPDAYQALFGRKLTDFEEDLLPFQVGLWVHRPEGPAGMFPQLVGQADLAPSLAHLTGLSTRKLPWIGYDVFGPKHEVLPLAWNSFVGGDHLFRFGADFTHSRCYQFSTRTAVDVEACREGFERASKQLEISSDVVTSNLDLKLMPL